jgi:hypothetical protein
VLPSKTVFVLGAGASHEVGLPIGSELKLRIGKKLTFTVEFGMDLKGADQVFFSCLRRDTGPNINAYLAACRSINQGIELGESIDDFIDTHRHDKFVAECGKLAIARTILEAERSCSLFYERKHIDDTIPFAGLKNTWYTGFFQLLISGVIRSNVEKLFTNVTIISFNYDRCLEHFLAHAVAAHYQMQAAEASALVQKLTIHRPYGSVGTYFGSSPVEFGLKGMPPLHQITKTIRTYTEQVESEKELAAIRDAIREAATVVFLGTQFHRNNMALLSEGSENLDPKRIFATRKGISNDDLAVVSRRILKLYRSGQPSPQDRMEYHYADTCNELFSQYRMLLRE